ncbi:MAG TPA: NAD(P)H-dependent oxidoreductase [Chitinophagaceae bacterium]|nr:NAD(P)H-dependent oxidoreductase [Chitinophagaceae bacterium]
MTRVLLLFAHPALEKSRIHARLIRNLSQSEGIFFHDLYEAYPDFDIDVRREQQLLLENDLVIWQHPFYWYSAPALIKQWQDLVLEHNWAYGSSGRMLQGKKILNAISCGGRSEAYSSEGRNRFTIRQLLAPFEQTARLCGMNYLPPFVVHGTHRLGAAEIEAYGQQYEQAVALLAGNGVSDDEYDKVGYLNELVRVAEIDQSK